MCVCAREFVCACASVCVRECVRASMRVCVCVSPHLQGYIGPVDAVVGDVEVECGRFFDAGERNGHVVVVGLQRDAPDVCVAGEQQEGLGDDAGVQIGHELQTVGTRARHALWLIEAQVTAAAVSVRTRVHTCTHQIQLSTNTTRPSPVFTTGAFTLE